MEQNLVLKWQLLLTLATRVPSNGLLFPPCGMDDLAEVLKPKNNGGVLEHDGQVEVVSSLIEMVKMYLKI